MQLQRDWIDRIAQASAHAAFGLIVEKTCRVGYLDRRSRGGHSDGIARTLTNKLVQRKIPKADSCYWCGKPSTSDEHVPPQGLFPKKKDSPEGKNYRESLIVVRSCEKHNEEKSSDDQFLMTLLTHVNGANHVGRQQAVTKVSRSLGRGDKGERLYSAVFGNPEVVTTQEGHIMNKVRTDLQRLNRCFEGVARGIYRWEFPSRFLGECKVMPFFIEYDEESQSSEWVKLGLIDEVHENRANWPIRGDHPEVFTYSFGPAECGLIPMLMTFYGSLEVFVSFVPSPSQ